MFSRRMTFLIVMLGPILGSGAGVRAEIRSDLHEKSYFVSGTSAKDVAAFMRRRPLRGDYGPAIANIRPRYTHTFKTEQRKDHCRVTGFRLSIDFTMTLPKARNRQAFDRRTLGSGLIHLSEMVGMNLFGYEAQNCRKPSGFQRFATKLPGKFTLSRRDAKTTSICCVKPLNRA